MLSCTKLYTNFGKLLPILVEKSALNYILGFCPRPKMHKLLTSVADPHRKNADADADADPG
jgi:hypothetical protein